MLKAIKQDFSAYGNNSRNRLIRYYIALTSLGFYVMLLYRISSKLDNLGKIGTLFSRLIDLFANLMFGCYINPRAKIAGGLFLPHPNGIVIGSGVSIGEYTTIYQHVTLGSGSKGANAYPIIGSRVQIFANAILAGDIHVDDDAIIGAGAVVLSDVPCKHRAVGNPARVLAPKTSSPT